jgi:adenylate kinase
MQTRSLIRALLLAALPLVNHAAGQVSGGPLIVLVGPPLSGKTTQISLLEKSYGIPTIATDDIIHAHASDLQQFVMPGQNLSDMRYDPSITRCLRAKLDSMDTSKGIALDGYPATVLQSQDLAKIIADYGFKPVVLMQLEMSDSVVRKRAAKAGRAQDAPPELEQRIKEYHRQFDAIGAYFPNANIQKVDATKSIDKVSKEVDALLQAAGIRPKAK